MTIMAFKSKFEGIEIGCIKGSNGLTNMVRSESIQNRWVWRLGSGIRRGNIVLHVRTTTIGSTRERRGRLGRIIKHKFSI